MKSRRVGYIYKLMIFGMLLGTIPVVILGAFSYIRASSTILENAQEGTIQILKQSQLRAEQVLKTVEISVSSLVQTSLVNEVISLQYDRHNFDKFRQLDNAISQLYILEMGVTDVQLYSVHNDWIVDVSGLYSLKDLKDKDIPPVLDYFDMQSNVVWDHVDDKHVRFVKKNPAYSTEPSSFILAEVPISHMSKLLSKVSKLGSILILDSQSNLILEQDHGLYQQVTSNPEIIDFIQKTEELSGYTDADISQGNVGISFIKSEYNGWVYVSITSTDQLTADSVAIGWFTFLICLAIFTLILVLAFFGSRKMYFPIRTIYHSILGQSDHTKRQHDEIQFINQHILSMQKLQNEMNHQMTEQVDQLKEFFMRKLLQGEAKMNDIEEKMFLFPQASSWTRMRVIAVQLNTLEGSRYEEKDHDLIMFAINNIAAEIIPSSNGMIPILFGDHQVNMLGADLEDALFRDFADETCHRIEQAVNYYLKLHISIGISRVFFDFIDAGNAYAEGIDALKYRFRFGEDAIVYIEDIHPVISEQSIYPKRLELELVDAIKLYNTDLAKYQLRLFTEEIFDEPVSHNEFQLYLVRLLIVLIQLLQDSGIPLHSLSDDKQSLFDSLFELKFKQDVEMWFTDTIIVPMIELLEADHNSQLKNISKQVIQIIENEFDTDLTLESCATRINYHPHYISRIFRQETGTNFSEYLSQFRLKKAKRWLEETDMKIADISERLQYRSSTNFIRYFRKQEGITPGQYREKKQ